jgi:hypothetical protein
MAREISRFRARYDDGRTITVIEWQEEIPFRPLSGRSRTLGTAIHFTLSTGEGVEMIEPETYKLFDTNELLRKLG